MKVVEWWAELEKERKQKNCSLQLKVSYYDPVYWEEKTPKNGAVK